MWPISDQFKKALGYGPSFRTVCTFTPPGGTETVLDVLSGTVAVDSQARIRRQLSGFSISGNADLYDLIGVPGGIVRVKHGVQFESAAVPELVPVFFGEVVAPRQSVGGGVITFTGADMTTWLSRTSYDTPWVVAAGTSRVTAIVAALLDSRPGTVYSNTSSDVGMVPTQTIWTTGPLDLIADLTKAGNTEAFFGPDGTFIIRDLPTPSSPVVWSVSAGPGGTLKSADRMQPTDKRFNRVVVEPTARDASQTWAPQAAEITDTSHPLHKSKIGKATKKIQSPVATQTEALAMAQRILAIGTNGRAETLSLGAITNPALEGYDVIRAVTSKVNNDDARLYQHFIDTLSLDLVAHTMTAGTLSQVVTE